MNKNLITKISIIIFTMGISFAGLNFVLAAGEIDCTNLTSSSVDSCNATPEKCRMNPTTGCRAQGCSRPTQRNSAWFNNNNWLVDTPNSATGMTEDEINAYDKFSAYFGASIGSAESVREIQEKINIAAAKIGKCKATCEDGRFGDDTIEKLEICLPCNGDKDNGAVIEDGELVCKDGGKMDNQGCCEIVQKECFAPKIIIDDEENKKTYDINPLVIDIDYSENEEPVTIIDESKLIVKGGNIESQSFDNVAKKILLTVTPNEGDSSITIDIAEGVAESSGYRCGSAAAELTRCDKPAIGGSCSMYTGYFNKNECCEKCGTNEKINTSGTGCECDIAALKCADKKEKKADNACKCVCDPAQQCCGIKLNTVVPFIGDCIEMTTVNDTHDSNNLNTSNVNQLNAFPFLMMGLSKILVTVILIFSFLIVIAAGLMMVTGVYDEGNYKKGMTRIKNVVVALILLGSSGLILKLINPSFFGG